ncbi:response regulator transcription factor [Scatolibacter rhodanostii]|uniref:response regulator transcription factor n=1 Tax=Scatolibacter rhodanostii TaxID=2014781 RepID=UPI000C07933A|nr:helix-turn-helix domain-containing protein [Scatolibacter rhodanostii]
MYTILIVDDEQLALEGISYHVGASGIPFHWIMEAQSAEEALKIIETTPPDILLTDIKMGEKTGLDLIREATSLHPDLVTAIICGYPDFSFAQEALALGACGYLLKPVKKEEIKDVLLKATYEVSALRERQNISKDNYAFRRTLRDHQIQEAVNMLIIGGEQQGSFEALEEYLSPVGCWYQMAIFRLPVEGLKYSSNGLGKTELMNSIHHMIDELLGMEERKRGLVTQSIEHENVLVGIFISDKESQSQAEKELQGLIVKIRQKIENIYPFTLSVSTSDTHKTLSVGLYTEAALAQDLRFSLPIKAKNEILQFKEYKNLPFSSHAEDLQTLRKFLNTNDISRAKDLIKSMMLKYKEISEFGIRHSYASIINAISVACYKNGNSILTRLGSESISGSILNTFEDVEGVFKNLHNIIANNIENASPESESAGEIMVRIRQYIDASFMDNELGTNKLSKEFSISLGYLSASYKKEHGITISKYIIFKRMEYATKLLKETTFSVSEIAETCGFNNLSYFMRLFKNTYAITPSQYRARFEKNKTAIVS